MIDWFVVQTGLRDKLVYSTSAKIAMLYEYTDRYIAIKKNPKKSYNQSSFKPF